MALALTLYSIFIATLLDFSCLTYIEMESLEAIVP